MKKRVLMGVMYLAMVALLLGCGKEPVAQIDAVKAAVEAAKTAQADVYLPADYSALRDSLNAVLADIETQKSKLFKSFGTVKPKLDQVLAQAGEVAAKTGTKKEEVKREAEALMTEIRTVIEENKTLITKAPRGKEGQAVLEQIKAEMTAIEGSLGETQGLLEKGAFMDALNRIRATNESAKGINTELKDAIAKVKR